MINNNKLFIMMGCPGSGKSSFVIDHIDYKHEAWISRDEIRFSMVAEDEEYFSKEKEVFEEFVRKINNSLDAGFNVYADATHLNKASRRKLLKAINPKFVTPEINVVWIKTPLDECLKRNDKRIGTRAFVPKEAIHRMYSQIEKPEFEEGFDNIFIIEDNKPIKMFKRSNNII